MKRNNASKSSDRGNSNSAAIVVAIIGLIGTFITAYFGFRASTASTAMIIDATKTAQVSLTAPPGLTRIALLSTPQVNYSADCMGYERLNDWAQAIECYKQKIIANPDDFGELSNVARVYGNAGQFDKMAEIAHEMMVVAHNHEEEAEAILTLGVAYYNLGNYSSAIETLTRGLDSHYAQTNNYFLISQWLSRSYKANGEVAKACYQFNYTYGLADAEDMNQDTLDELHVAIDRNCH